MRFKLYIVFIVLVAFACDKNYTNIALTSHTEQKIVGEGFFTDSLMKHQFLFTVSADLGATELNYANDVSLLIKTPEGDQTFSRIGDGLYESDAEFKGEYGESYTIQFTYKENVHEIETTMPTPIAINEVYYQVFDSLNGYNGQGNIRLNISSPVDQYMRFDLYKGYIYASSPEDTIWHKVPLPAYRVAKINTGDSITMRLPIEDFDSFYLTSESLIRVETSLIPKEVGEYLLRLKNYVQNELLNNQSYNAPYYYSNEAYGLGYGTIRDTLIHQY
jgi:hypothetical protein